MNYHKVVMGTFLERPNRFIALCEVEGTIEKVHVKNTGRCKELLIPGTKIYLSDVGTSHRKTKYDLIAVQKGNTLINIDSQAPNKILAEAITLHLRLPYLAGTITLLKKEKIYGTSRFDFYFETDQNERGFIEVKGMTLEQNQVVSFPDAPTLRGLKHVEELGDAMREGFKAYVIFIIQMTPVNYATIQTEIQPKLAEVMQEKIAEGLHVLAYNCHVSPDKITLKEAIPFYLSSP